MSYRSYLARLEDTIRSRCDIEFDELQVDARTTFVIFSTILRFYDGSRLAIFESIKILDQQNFARLRYTYHYQDTNDKLIFRYDNSPHYPDLPTFPSHKHIGDEVVAADPPDLADVLREIDALIYPKEDD